MRTSADERIESLSLQTKSLLYRAEVSAVDPAQARVRVRDGEWESGWVKWIAGRASAGEASWSAPQIGDAVLCAAVEGKRSETIVLGAVYSAAAPPPFNTLNKHGFKFSDGGVVHYDDETSTLQVVPPAAGAVTIIVGGSNVHVEDGAVSVNSDSVTVTAQNVQVDASQIELGGSGGKKIARVGDLVNLQTGKILEGSDVVTSK